MYDELIAELRQHHCDAKEDDTQEVCEECAYDVIIADESVPSGIASVCVCGLMNRAANAIEELQNKVDRAIGFWDSLEIAKAMREQSDAMPNITDPKRCWIFLSDYKPRKYGSSNM